MGCKTKKKKNPADVESEPRTGERCSSCIASQSSQLLFSTQVFNAAVLFSLFDDDKHRILYTHAVH